MCGFRGAGGVPGHQGMASPARGKTWRSLLDVEAILHGRVPANDKPVGERSMHLEGIISEVSFLGGVVRISFASETTL